MKWKYPLLAVLLSAPLYGQTTWTDYEYMTSGNQTTFRPVNGFYFNLDTGAFVAKPPSPSLSANSMVLLKSVGLSASVISDISSKPNYNVDNALLVVGADNVILGYSNTITQQFGADLTNTYTFNGIHQSDLWINTGETYRFLAVQSSVIDAILNNNCTTYKYTAGTIDNNAQISISGSLGTISGGLGYCDSQLQPEFPINEGMDIAVIESPDGSSIGNGMVSINSIKLQTPAIPEPSTFTLGLVGLGTLLLRRKRKV